ncbi:MAG: ferritin-like domain-containing protein [Alphaproteobacteria bacterium]|nr:ferritin-like domain-containing protein [Alphaproteobacteria bacterium]
MPSISDRAVAILNTADPWAKAAMTREAVAAAAALEVGSATPPDRPARPDRPELRRPGDMPKRSTGPKGKIALVHALVHIELNAVDLAWDIIARFGQALPRAFVDDWVTVADEEAEHFLALDRRLKELGAAYGELPAHDGLWQAAQTTAHDILARLAIVPLTLEARGLDTTPATCNRLRGNGDETTADILDVIYREEIKHLAVGICWFEHICADRGLDAPATYRDLLDKNFTGTLKGPFNRPARDKAGMTAAYLPADAH